jgi:hypothetical protein
MQISANGAIMFDVSGSFLYRSSCDRSARDRKASSPPIMMQYDAVH